MRSSQEILQFQQYRPCRYFPRVFPNMCGSIFTPLYYLTRTLTYVIVRRMLRDMTPQISLLGHWMDVWWQNIYWHNNKFISNCFIEDFVSINSMSQSLKRSPKNTTVIFASLHAAGENSRYIYIYIFHERLFW